MKYRFNKQVFWVIPILVINCIVYWGARALTNGRTHYDMSLSLDSKIPFVPQMIIIYLGCYLFWAACYIAVCNQDKKKVCRFAAAEVLGKLVCFIIFLVLPTTMTRAQITDSGFWNSAVAFLYKMDEPNMLFPSIHCYVSWMCYLGVKHMTAAKKWVVNGVLSGALLVCLSTLLVKQHVIVDCLAGVLLAEICFWAVEFGGKCFAKKSN